jgi:sulfite reductase (NADPH) flavoprotein alpha-component
MSKFSLKDPFETKIIDRKLLSKNPDIKKVYLITFDIKDSNFTYDPGDSIGIIPQNDPRIVDLTIKEMKADKDDIIIHPKQKKEKNIYEFLLNEANIIKASHSLVKKLDKKLKPEEIKELIQSHHIWDLLKKYPKHKLSPQEIIDILLPQLPRLYSVASSQIMHNDKINLLIAHVSYDLSNIKRNGVTTEFVCHLAKENITKIKIYSREAHNFKLPKKNKPIIMIGPGVGLAPFIGFLEERYITKSSNKNWLFFGDRSEKDCFYFEDFLKKLENENFLKLSTAFSRDQNEKKYVQHKIYENAKEIIQWLDDGAYIYICGDAKNMARDVEKAFLDIFQKEKNISSDDAKNYLDHLRAENRYLKDVY